MYNTNAGPECVLDRAFSRQQQHRDDEIGDDDHHQQQQPVVMRERQHSGVGVGSGYGGKKGQWAVESICTCNIAFASSQHHSKMESACVIVAYRDGAVCVFDISTGETECCCIWGNGLTLSSCSCYMKGM